MPDARGVLVVMFLVTPPGTSSSRAQDATDLAWQAKKCAIYADEWADALAMRGKTGIGQEFIDRQATFIAAGCLGDRNVCPRSPEELRLADLLTLMAVSEGIAGTFLPFGCRD